MNGGTYMHLFKKNLYVLALACMGIILNCQAVDLYKENSKKALEAIGNALEVDLSRIDERISKSTTLAETEQIIAQEMEVCITPKFVHIFNNELLQEQRDSVQGLLRKLEAVSRNSTNDLLVISCQSMVTMQLVLDALKKYHPNLANDYKKRVESQEEDDDDSEPQLQQELQFFERFEQADLHNQVLNQFKNYVFQSIYIQMYLEDDFNRSICFNLYSDDVFDMFTNIDGSKRSMTSWQKCLNIAAQSISFMHEFWERSSGMRQGWRDERSPADLFAICGDRMKIINYVTNHLLAALKR